MRDEKNERLGRGKGTSGSIQGHRSVRAGRLGVVAVALALVAAAAFAVPAFAAGGSLGDFGSAVASFLGFAPRAEAAEKEVVADPSTLDNWKATLDTPTKNVGRIWTDKSVSKGSDADFLVGLSALSSASNLMTEKTQPLDIVLVLDTSDSMTDENVMGSVYDPVYDLDPYGTYFILGPDNRYLYVEPDEPGVTWSYKAADDTIVEVKPKQSESDTDGVQFYQETQIKKLEALKTVVSELIDSIARKNASVENPEKYDRIAIEQFATTPSVPSGFTDVAGEDNIKDLKDSVERLAANGTTNTKTAFQRLSDLLESARGDAKKVVIFFTDGEPSRTSSGFDSGIASDTVDYANTIKAAGTTIYSVGVFHDADPADTEQNFNKFMHAVSSNYPDATCGASGSFDSLDLGDRADGSFYLSAKNSDELSGAFETILTEIQSVDASAPTELPEGTDAGEGGYITFTDTLGSYMRVTGDTLSVVYGGETYTAEKNDDGQFVFADKEVSGNGVYESANLKDLEVTVTRNTGSAGDVVKVQIPASLIPCRSYEVTGDGANQSMTISEVEPIRVLFNVSLDSSVNAEALEEALYDESDPLHGYIFSHLSEDKKSVTFLSNRFSGQSVAENVTVGDTTATFTPSTGNMFYRFTEDTPIYADEDLQTRVTKVADLDASGATSYYYPYTYHVTSDDGAVESVTEAVEFPGSNIVKEGEGKNVAEGNNGAYIMEGSDRVTRIDNINEEKAENATETASTVLSPIWQDISQRSGNGGLSAIVARLGNNGKVFFKLPGTLEVTKTVDYGNGDAQKLAEKDFSFTFTLKLTGSPAGKTYTGVITNENDVKPSEVAFSATGGSFTLKNGEKLTVKGLVDGMGYTVEETGVPAWFIQSATNASGTIAANDTVTASFTNTYKAQPAKESFPVSKELSGRDWRDSDAFTFTLSAVDGAPMPAEGGETVTIQKDTANHAATFGEISFDKIGTYVYHIKENITGSTIPGLSYSGATYKVTVEVTDDLAGQLQSEMTITQVQDEGALTVLEGERPALGTAEFKNTYNYEEGTAVISGTKSYTDHTGGNNIEDGKFTFKLAPVDGAPMPQDKDGNVVDEVSNVGKNFSFPAITFDGNDVGETYAYTITEQAGNETGMTYDGTAFKAYISVTEANDEDGKAVISATVTYKMVGENGVETDVEQPTFENEYNADPAKLALGGTKELAGRDMKETDTFTFCLVPSEETLDSASVMVGESPITKDGLKQTVSGPAEKGEGKPFSFNELTFTQAGVYTFGLYEEQGNAGGVTYDTEYRTVTVTVTLDKANNKLVASANYGTIGNGEDARPGNEFVNTYKAMGTYQGVNVAVKLVGKPMSTGDFGFTITSDDQDALAKLAENDKSFANGTNQDSDVFETMAKLPNMTFDQDDAGKTFVYTVDEIMPSSGEAMPGVDYDESEYILEITVIDNGDGTMSTSTKITQVKDSEGKLVNNVIYETTPESGGENPTIPFINIYTPKPATATLNVTKAVYGKDAIESFGFDLTLFSGDESSVKVDQDDGSLADFTGAKLATSGSIKAGATETLTSETLTFTKVGTYVFTVDETTTTDKPGWHYDEATHAITVEVTDENYDGQLDAAVKDDNPTFTNYYADATIGGDTKQPLPVNKIVKAQNVGSDWSTDNDFNFTLAPVTGEGDDQTDWSSTSCGTNSLKTGIADSFKSGDKKTAHFGEITFYEVGEYHFVVTEDEAQQQEPAGWTYDKSKKEITVTVTDEDTTDGKLDVTVEGDATFTNTFDPSAVEFTPLPVTKVVKPNDAGLTPAGYQFELSVSNTLEGHKDEGFELPEDVISKSNGEGAVTFGNITFTQAGTYEVTVKEVVPEDANQEQPGIQDENHITYDQHVFTYTVDVTVGEGTLVASVDESTVTSGADTFTNVYFDPVKEVSGSADDGTLTDGSVAAVGDVLTYTIHWSNNAVDKDGVPTNATVTVTDKVPEHTTYVANSASQGGFEKDGKITWTFKNQVPGASGTVTYEVTVDESAAQVGAVDNTATVQIGENGPDIDTNTVTTVIPSKDVVAPSDPDTSIDGQLVGVGDELAYVISYANPYEEPSTVTITDAVPTGTEFVSADNGGTQSDGKVTWTIEEVPAGESGTGTVSFTVRVTEEAVDNPGNQVTNEATVKIGDHDPVVTNEVHNVVPEKDVFRPGDTNTSIDGQLVAVGDQLRYEIAYTNGEDSEADVTITDKVPDGTAYVKDSAAFDESPAESKQASYDEETKTVTWTLSKVRAGESGTVSFIVEVTKDALQQGTVENTAKVQIGEDDPGVDTNPVKNPVTGKDVFKADDPTTSVDGQLVGVGDELKYVITYTNPDDQPSTVTITDTVPAGTEFVSADPDVKPDENGLITWTINDVATNTKGSVSFTVRVTEDAVDNPGNQVTNEATVKIGDHDPVVTNEVDNVVPEKDVYAGDNTTGESIDGDTVSVGDELTYTILWANTAVDEQGNPTAATVTITDVVPEGTEYVANSASDGGTEKNGAVTWTIDKAGANTLGTVSFKVRVTEEALEKDAVTNQATVKIGENGPEVKTNTTENPVKKGKLTISKTIELTEGQGTVIDKDQEFQFTVKVLDTEGNPIAGAYSDLDFSDEGIASFSLRHGESMTIEGLPAGATYTVTETPVDHYTQTTPADGAPETGTIPADGTAEAAFVNTYKADDSDPTTLELTKVFEGHEWTEGYSFTFVLAGENGAPMPENSTVTVSGPQPTGEATIAFGPITYKSVGTYTYTVTETAGENPGIGYDTHTAKVTVEVSDVDGKLTPSVAYEKDVFTNTYDTGTVTVDTAVGLQVVKNMTGRDIKPGDFTFTMAGTDDASVARLNDGKPLFFSTSGAALDSASNVVSETINVPTGLTFTSEDAGNTYTYTVSENVPEGAVNNELDGVTYDDTIYTVAFAITENGKGTLSVETFVDGESQGVVSAAVATNALPAQLVFDNSYDAGEASVDVSATKVLKNHELADGMFTFDVYNDSVAEGGEARHVLTASNAADGSVALGTLSYTTAGLNADVAAGYATRTAGEGRSATYVYGYTVHEAPVEGVTNNTGDLHFTVTVTDDGAGHLTAEATLPEGDLVFHNTYGTTESANLSISGIKVLRVEGDNLTPPDITGKYTFTITGVDEQGNELPAELLPEQTQVNNQESGTVDFGSVSYTMASVFGDTGAVAEDGTETASLEPRQRTFTYTVTESGEVPGVVNDPEPTRTITVTVTDNGDGTISVAKASDEASDQPGTDFVFTNVYRVRPATSTPTGDGGFNFNKSLVSPFDRPLLEGEFNFQMTDGEGNVVSEATNAADGTISMPAIEFGAPGDYAYTLAEVAGDKDGITYDARTYTVTAHVADKGDGTLGVTWSVDGVEPGGTVTFTNECAPAPTSITLGARKVLEGRELRAGEFTFQILEGNVVVSTGTNAADGSVEFEPIVYDAPGEHDYTIVEVAGSDAGMTYDDTVYTVHVSVTNNVEANRLETSWSYGEAGQPVFHNSFVEPPEDEPDEPSDGPHDEPSDGPSGEPSGEPPLPAAGDPLRAMPVVAVALAGCVAAIFSALRLRRQR